MKNISLVFSLIIFSLIIPCQVKAGGIFSRLRSNYNNHSVRKSVENPDRMKEFHIQPQPFTKEKMLNVLLGSVIIFGAYKLWQSNISSSFPIINKVLATQFFIVGFFEIVDGVAK